MYFNVGLGIYVILLGPISIVDYVTTTQSRVAYIGLGAVVKVVVCSRGFSVRGAKGAENETP